MDLALNNLQRFICHKKQTNKPTNKSINLVPVRSLELLLINKRKKKENLPLMDFVVLTNHRGEIKENEKRDKYFDLAWEQKIGKTREWLRDQ